MFSVDEADTLALVALTLLDIAIKATAILTIAWAASTAMRRTSAAARHLVWLMAVAGVLILPALSVILPSWQVLPRNVPMETTAPPSDAPSTALRQPIGADHMATPLPPPVDAERARIPAPELAAPVAPFPEPINIARQATGAGGSGWTWILIVWAAGAVISILPLILGMLSLRLLRRKARPIVAGSWPMLLDRLAADLGVTRLPILLQGPRHTIPMTFGALAGIAPASLAIGRAKVLIPEDAADWSVQRRRAVLLHELAHIKRCDCLTQLVTHFACAVYWFNPLIWLAARRMLTERERACDDMVLAAGVKSSDYAEHILEIAAATPARRVAAFAGIRFARRSKLEDRLSAILDKTHNRRAMTRLTIAASIVLLAIAASGPVALAMSTRASECTATTGSATRVADDSRRF